MKTANLMKCWILWLLFTLPVQGQETNEIQQLRRQLQRMQEEFDQVQRQHREQIETLSRQLRALEDRRANTNAAEAKPPPDTKPSATELPRAEASVPEKQPWRPSDPIRLGQGGKAFMDIGLVGTFAAGGSTAKDIEGATQLGGHDPNQNGFTVQGLEANFAGAVDPYFRGQANVAFQIDSQGKSAVELEEGYLETLSLPGNLQVRAGQFLSEFGRLNPTHPHAWSFVDAPLVNGRLLGPDGLRNPGARISWLMPTPFYSEVFLGVQNSQGETAYSFRDDHEAQVFYGRLDTVGGVRSFNDLLFTPRLATSFDLTDSQTLVWGVSGAFGPNASGPATDTQIYATDLYWKWKPANHSGGFPFLAWQTEAMLRRYEAGAFSWDLDGNGVLNPDGSEMDSNRDGVPDLLPRETLVDYGLYTQLTYGFHKGWVAGLRWDYVASNPSEYESLYGPDLSRARRWRLSPNLTWYPSEFSKLRLQYNCDDRDPIGIDHSVWFQFEFLLGAHAAHKF